MPTPEASGFWSPLLLLLRCSHLPLLLEPGNTYYIDETSVDNRCVSQRLLKSSLEMGSVVLLRSVHRPNYSLKRTAAGRLR